MRRRPQRARSAGFTLVEALIATLLMAIVLSTLATVTAQWLPNWNRGFARVQRAELFSVGLERLLGDLAAAEIVSAGDHTAPPLFDGAELSVTFVRTVLGPNTGSGLEIVRFAEVGSERGPALVRMTAPFAPSLPSPASGGGLGWGGAEPLFVMPITVIRAPYRVSFSYAGSDRVWRETWRGAPQLPRLVRVSVRDAATSRTLAVSASAVIRAELPARCVAARTQADCPFVAAAPASGADANRGGPAGAPGGGPPQGR